MIIIVINNNMIIFIVFIWSSRFQQITDLSSTPKTGIMTYSKSMKLFFHIFIYLLFFCEILNLHGIYHYSTEIWQHRSKSESL